MKCGEMMSLGDRITELRKARGMSQGDLAEAMDVTRQAVSKWENELASPDTIKLIQLADVLDTDVEYLATGKNTVLRRPPVVIKSVEYVEKVVKKPVIEYVDKVIEKKIPVIEYVEKPIIKEVPVIKKVVRTAYKRNILEYCIIGTLCFVAGLMIGLIF